MQEFEDFHYPALTRITFDVHKIPYTLYKSNNKFDGTPIPEGYEPIYIDDGIFPPSLRLRKNEKI